MRSALDWVVDPVTRMELELEQWGAWVRSGAGIPQLVCILGRLRGSTVATPQISDDRALVLDAAMARLRVHAPVWADAVHAHYARRLQPRRWAEELGLSEREAVRTVLPAAVRWLASETF